VDPPEGGDSEEESEDGFDLPELTLETLFQLYYEPLLELFRGNVREDSDRLVTWRRLEDLDLEIGILSNLHHVLRDGRFDMATEAIGTVSRVGEFTRRFGYWAGDGLFVNPGAHWLEAFAGHA